MKKGLNIKIMRIVPLLTALSGVVILWLILGPGKPIHAASFAGAFVIFWLSVIQSWLLQISERLDSIETAPRED